MKANYQLGLLLTRMGKKDEADKRLEIAKSLRTGRRSQFTLATSPAGPRPMNSNSNDRSTGWPLPYCSRLRAVRSAQKAEQPPRRSASLRPALKRDPKNPKLHVALGLAYWDRNDYPHALEAFQRAVKVGPNSAEAHNWLGVAIMEKADLPGAIAEFKKAVALDPKYARAYTNLGSALAKSGEIGEAVEAFQEGAGAGTRQSCGAHEPGRGSAREGRCAKARWCNMRRVAEREPTNASVQYELGQTLRQSGDLPGAIAAFENALQIDPELREGYYGLGLALKQQGAAVRKESGRMHRARPTIYTSARRKLLRGAI